MGKMQRAKGSKAERELAALLFDELGIQFERNLHQYQAAGELDLAPKPGQPQVGFLIEVKRRETEELNVWWREAHAFGGEKRLILFYRRSRQPWRALVDLNDLVPDAFPRRGSFAIIGFADACTILRESVHA